MVAVLVVVALVAGGAVWVLRAADAGNLSAPAAPSDVAVSSIALDIYPQRIAVNPWSHELYVPAGDSIQVVNPNTAAIDHQISVPQGGSEIVHFDTVGRTAWTHNNTRDNAPDSHIVSVIDAATHELVRTIRFSRPVIALGIDPELGRAFVINRPDDQTQTPEDESWVTVVDTETYEQLDEYRLPLAGYGVYIDPSSHIGYIPGWMGTAIFFTKTPNVLESTTSIMDSNSSSVQVAVDEVAHRAYVYTSDDMVTFDSESGVEIARTSLDADITEMVTGNNGIVYSIDSESDTLSVYDSTTWQVLDEITVGDQPISIARDPESGDLFTSDNAGQSITVVRIEE
ncbi:YncE family protein [Rhodococcoides fascians]|uniref:YncE family protein n=1 Tax=Rhodococcoides fascians TaxID=1828 RepID=UPI0012D30B37|nr:hypothetical protein [Rhodococcus fascians]